MEKMIQRERDSQKMWKKRQKLRSESRGMSRRITLFVRK